jgi:hypothetical protein
MLKQYCPSSEEQSSLGSLGVVWVVSYTLHISEPACGVAHMGFQLRDTQVGTHSANNTSDLRVLEFREEKSCPQPK